MKNKAEKEARQKELFDKMKALFDEVEKRDTDFTDEEKTNYNTWNDEYDSIEERLKLGEEQESRQKEIAKKEAAKKEEKRKIEKIASDLEGKKDPDVTVKGNKLESKEARNAKVFSMIQGNVRQNPYMTEQAQRSLIEGGHFDDILEGRSMEEFEKRGGFSTLLDGKGGVFIPTTVSSEIMDIMQDYGVIPRLANNFGNISQNNLKIPQILGRPAFSAVSQGGAITGSGFNLGGIELKALKWGCIIDWTNEVTESVGATLMPIIMKKLAEGFAYAQDDAFFNGAGTSAYNGIRGLENLAGSVDYVRQADAVSGNISFATLDPDDFITPQENVAPGVRSGCVYTMHPNLIFTLRKLKDTAGNYIYGSPSEQMKSGTLWGYPIETSEAFAYTDGVSKTVCAFFNPSYIAYATGRNLTATALKEGTITNEDSTSVNLATQDGEALRVTGLFDLVLSSVTRSTAGTAEGAFSVLKTAAS